MGKQFLFNHQAQKILRQADGIKWSHAELKFDERRHSNIFSKLLGQAALTSQQKGIHPGGGMRVDRPSGRSPYQLIVMPLNSHTEQQALVPHAVACVFLHDPDLDEALSVDVLRTLYRLTPAEAKVAQLLYRGKSPSRDL